MAKDFRETIIGCGAVNCRFNVNAGVETTCSLKLIYVDETGRCRMAEGKRVQQPPQPQQEKKGGHFENGVFIP